MKKILQFLFEHKTLSREEAKEVLLNISKGIYSDTEIASFTTVFLMRNITIPELMGLMQQQHLLPPGNSGNFLYLKKS